MDPSHHEASYYVLRYFTDIGVGAAIGGSVALVLHGITRNVLLHDVDILVWDEYPGQYKDKLKENNSNFEHYTNGESVYSGSAGGVQIQFLPACPNSGIARLHIMNHQRDTTAINGLRVL
jgi:hypothetical protein